MHQLNESSVVYDMLGQAWIRHSKQCFLVETMFFWMWGTIVVHMLYIFHLWCCAHVVMYVYSVCTCFYAMIMYKVVQIVLCAYVSLHMLDSSVLYIWCYVHVGYVVLCTCVVACISYMWCYVYMVFFAWLYKSCCVYVVLCTCCTSGTMCR